MSFVAESKFVRISPRKVRLVASTISGLSVKDALLRLSLIKKRAGYSIVKTLKSAVSNALNNAKISEEKLRVKTIVVGEGPGLKRFRPAPRGRVRRYKKRSSHIKVILEEGKEERSYGTESQSKNS